MLEVGGLQRSLQRGAPFGGEAWTNRVIGQLGLESTDKPRGRLTCPQKLYQAL